MSLKNRNRTGDYIIEILVNIILISIFSRLVQWFSFISDSFFAVLPLFYISFSITIMVNIILIIIPEIRIRHILKTLTSVVSLIVLISLYYIFPFDFTAYSGNWEIIARIIILLAVFGTSIATVVELIATIFSKNKRGSEV
ncbi:MAG: hypothetical protein BWY43_00088 [candidate division WS2 bacterium ADurb.Bin280]|uniref:Uncharacterized protein n=1 Tax=candidate division WS2 bacterium ADurb.Bin280 TaxID=1852829 RepID=A0A1V5SFQ6_9BACT|nr:MAG: hypothetical protein BWY43_00088 [candidate division WS2 bacterium ADurb.Bin280]